MIHFSLGLPLASCEFELYLTANGSLKLRKNKSITQLDSQKCLSRSAATGAEKATNGQDRRQSPASETQERDRQGSQHLVKQFVKHLQWKGEVRIT